MKAQDVGHLLKINGRIWKIESEHIIGEWFKCESTELLTWTTTADCGMKRPDGVSLSHTHGLRALSKRCFGWSDKTLSNMKCWAHVVQAKMTVEYKGEVIKLNIIRVGDYNLPLIYKHYWRFEPAQRDFHGEHPAYGICNTASFWQTEDYGLEYNQLANIMKGNTKRHFVDVDVILDAEVIYTIGFQSSQMSTLPTINVRAFPISVHQERIIYIGHDGLCSIDDLLKLMREDTINTIIRSLIMPRRLTNFTGLFFQPKPQVSESSDVKPEVHTRVEPDRSMLAEAVGDAFVWAVHSLTDELWAWVRNIIAGSLTTMDSIYPYASLQALFGLTLLSRYGMAQSMMITLLTTMIMTYAYHVGLL